MSESSNRAETLPEALASDLDKVESLATRPETVDAFLRHVLDALSDALPVDVATFYEFKDTRLVVRARRGETGKAPSASTLDPDAVTEIRDALEARQTVVLSEAHSLDPVRTLPDGESCLLVPVTAGDDSLGLLVFESRDRKRYDAETLALGRIYGLLIGLGLAAARHAAELERYQQSLREQNRLLVEEVAADADAAAAIECSLSRAMRRVAKNAKQVAITDAPVLITGETGTGKEVLARAIHAWSRRADSPFIQVNCAALPESLVESELFGHRRGAFSGAVEDRMGRFRLADGGTLLLDEVGDLPPAIQVKLLRVLQEGAFEPVGGDETESVDVRVLAATNVDLEQAIREGRFREDLFYRLNVFPIRIPPLRDRLEDLPVLAERILERIRRRTGRGPWHLHEDSLVGLRRHDWPGNVRELVNALERARIASPAGGPLDVEVSRSPRSTVGPEAPAAGSERDEWPSLDVHQKRYIERVLERTGGKIYGDGGAAELLGVPPTTLQSRMRRLGVERSRSRKKSG